MSAEANKALVRRFYEEVWDKGNLDVVYEVYADDYIRHDLRPGIPVTGPEGQKVIAAEFRNAFPDLHWHVDLVEGSEEFIVGRWTGSGTHTGPWGKLQPTGKTVKFSGANIFRFENGKVAEIWNHRDDYGLFLQVGFPVHAGYPDNE